MSNDDDYGTLLLRPLDNGTPAGSNRIDVTKAMRNGRRVRRVRTWSTGAAVTAGVAVAVTGGVLVLRPPVAALPPVLPADPGLATSCTAAALPIGDEKSASVDAGDPSGTYLVGSSEPVHGGDQDVMVWRDGKLIANVPQRNPQVGMLDINASGIAVGSTTAGNSEPYAYHDGKVSRMKGTGTPVAISDAGVVAGDSESGSEWVPQRWSTWDAEPEKMRLPAGMTNGQAFDMTEDGSILTTLMGDTGGGMYLWHADNSVEKIEPPKAGPKEKAEIRPIAIHFGWIYANVQMSAGNSSNGMPAPVGGNIYRYEPSSKTWQKLASERDAAQIPAVQRRGGNFIADKPSVYVGKEILKLPVLKKYQDDAFGVTVISENGRIAAGSNMSGVAAERPVVPVIWRCR
jgi:hypothetical protein